MMFRKIASNLQISSNMSGGALTYDVPAGAGGRKIKVAQYMLVVKQYSSSNVRIWVELTHGPDGKHYTTHSDVIGSTGSPVPVPVSNLLSGDADESIIIGEFLQPCITISDSASTSQVWAVVDVYEMLKPF